MFSPLLFLLDFSRLLMFFFFSVSFLPFTRRFWNWKDPFFLFLPYIFFYVPISNPGAKSDDLLIIPPLSSQSSYADEGAGSWNFIPGDGGVSRGGGGGSGPWVQARVGAAAQVRVPSVITAVPVRYHTNGMYTYLEFTFPVFLYDCYVTICK